MNFFFLSFLTLNFLNFVYGNLSFNAVCSSKNLDGKCVDIDTCKPYAKAYKNLPDRLEYFPICNNELRYICCPMPPGEINVAASSTRKPKMLVTTSWPDSEERKSTKKCREYLEGIQSRISLRNGNCLIDLSENVVGGIEAEPHEFPHQALIGYKFANEPYEWKCGGSLISPEFVLSAAHCVPRDYYNYNLAVKLGMHSRLEMDDSTVGVLVNQVIKHPDAGRFKNDLALFRLSKKVTFSQNIYPICLPDKDMDEYNAIATGFGYVNINRHLPDNLQKVTLDKYSYAECAKHIPSIRNVTKNSILCYGHREEIKDVCKGDSGGPLQVRTDDRVLCSYTQIGGVSFGVQGCGKHKTPSIYFNVYHYIDWIEQIVWPN